MVKIGFKFALVVLLIGCFENIATLDLGNMLIPKEEATAQDALVKWIEIEKSMKNGIESVIRQLLPTIINSGSEVEIDVDCMSDLLKIVFDLRQLKSWAVKLVDSFGKPSGGNVQGTVSMLGHYKECQGVVFPRGEYDDEEEETTTGQYCIIDVALPLPPKPKKYQKYGFANHTFKTELMKDLSDIIPLMYAAGIRIAICIPSTCSKTDLSNMVVPSLSSMNLNAVVYSCDKREPFRMDTVQIAIAATIFSLVMFNVIATMIDYIWTCRDEQGSKKPKSLGGLLTASFSILRNGGSVINPKPLQDQSLSCLDGIRVLSMTWVILGHSFISVEPHLMRNLVDFQSYLRGWAIQAILNGIFSVETFYLIASVLMSYQIVKAIDSVGPSRGFNVPIIIIKRIWRLVPTLLLIMGLSILLPLIGSGPFWKETANWFAGTCRNNWWRTILFIHNFFSIKEMCLPHTWYLGPEFQCFLLGLIYIALLVKNSKLGHAFLGLMMVTSIVSSGLVNYAFDFSAALTIDEININEYFTYVHVFYAATYTHLGVFGVGLALGTFLARKGKFQLSMTVALVGWLLASVVGLTLVYCIHPWNNKQPPGEIASHMYSAFSRTSWGVCVSWVIFACSLGKGGPVNSFLSWSAFKPFAQISFATYLMHVLVVYGFTASLQSNFQTTIAAFVWIFFGNLCISSMAGAGVKILFELPMLNIFNIAYGAFIRRTRTTKPEINGVSNAGYVKAPPAQLPPETEPVVHVTNGVHSSKL